MRRFPYIKQNSIAEIVSTMESFLVAEVGFEPHDLRVMSPTSYQAALLRDIMFSPFAKSIISYLLPFVNPFFTFYTRFLLYFFSLSHYMLFFTVLFVFIVKFPYSERFDAFLHQKQQRDGRCAHLFVVWCR